MAKEEKKQPKPKLAGKVKGALQTSVNLPAPGSLGKTVRTPNWLKRFGGYFVGAWQELREVSWPNRRASWSLTFAVLLFVFVLVAFIFGVDTAFEQLFKGVFIK